MPDSLSTHAAQAAKKLCVMFGPCETEQQEDNLTCSTCQLFERELLAFARTVAQAQREADMAAMCALCRAGSPVERSEHGVWFHPNAKDYGYCGADGIRDSEVSLMSEEK